MVLRLVSIRFEVRGGFRQDPRHRCRGAKARVSIRFEVRGGFRLVVVSALRRPCFNPL